MAEVPLPETCCPATVWVRPGQAAYRGPSLRLDPHSGSVDCVVVGIDEPFTLRADGIGERRARSAVVPARTPHQVVAEGRVFFGYLGPRPDRSGVRVGLPGERDLIRHLSTDADPAHLFDRFGVPGPGRRMDERISAALRFMRTEHGLSAADVAREVHLSTSRFLHLFSAHTGTSFRRYRLWTRMTRVAAAVSTGQDLTRAATEAGFASSAHFSDSFRAMFGLTAGRLLAAGTRIVVTG